MQVSSEQPIGQECNYFAECLNNGANGSLIPRSRKLKWKEPFVFVCGSFFVAVRGKVSLAV